MEIPKHLPARLLMLAGAVMVMAGCDITPPSQNDTATGFAKRITEGNYSNAVDYLATSQLGLSRAGERTRLIDELEVVGREIQGCQVAGVQVSPEREATVSFTASCRRSALTFTLTTFAGNSPGVVVGSLSLS